MTTQYVTYDTEDGWLEAANKDDAQAGAERTLRECLDSEDGINGDADKVCAAVALPFLAVTTTLVADRADYDSDEDWEEAGYNSDHDQYFALALEPVNRGLHAIIEERPHVEAWLRDTGEASGNPSEEAGTLLAEIVLAADEDLTDISPEMLAAAPQRVARIGALAAALIDRLTAIKAGK